MQSRELAAHRHAQLGVEVRERLVHQERLRLAHHRPAHRNALALAAGELRRACGRAARRARASAATSRRVCARSRLRDLAELEAEAEILADRHVRVERVVLEDHRDVPFARGEFVTSSPPITTLPAETCSSPAIIRSSVVLPQPDGPTSTMNSPSPISRLTSSTALTSPGKTFVTCSRPMPEEPPPFAEALPRSGRPTRSS